MFDLVIKNGEIIDGTGKQGFVGDIGIKDGKIKAIGKLDAQDRPTIDAEGLVVSPGFIDIHSHSDFTLLSTGGREQDKAGYYHRSYRELRLYCCACDRRAL